MHFGLGRHVLSHPARERRLVVRKGLIKVHEEEELKMDSSRVKVRRTNQVKPAGIQLHRRTYLHTARQSEMVELKWKPL